MVSDRFCPHCRRYFSRVDYRIHVAVVREALSEAMNEEDE